MYVCNIQIDPDNKYSDNYSTMRDYKLLLFIFILSLDMHVETPRGRSFAFLVVRRVQVIDDFAQAIVCDVAIAAMVYFRTYLK